MSAFFPRGASSFCTARCSLSRRQGSNVIDNQSPRAFIGEYLQQEAICHFVRNDVYPIDTISQRSIDGGSFRQHAIGQLAVFSELIQSGTVDIGYE